MKYSLIRHQVARAAALFTIIAVAVATNARAVTINTVAVGNLGNASDSLSTTNNPTNLLFGKVNYNYGIGVTEVTNAQYIEFLNAKAKSDPLGLYNQNMGSDSLGGITQSGPSGSYVYTARANMGNKPVNFVNFFDALRFANWMNNGQGTGSTETGAYTLLGGTQVPSNATTVTRNGGSLWALTSENEWYKGAFYDPTLAGGTGGYWDYATQSNTIPTVATINGSRDITNPGFNVANHNTSTVTTVASAGPLSDSFYGTYDQSGNVWEWNESIISGSLRGLRGGSWFLGGGNMHAAARGFENPIAGTGENSNVGFRLSMVPEPSTAVLAAMAGVLVLGWKRRRAHG